MSSNADNTDCNTKCWKMAALVGVLALLLLWMIMDRSFLWSLIGGIGVFAVLGFVLKSMWCKAEPQAMPAPTPAPRPTPAQPSAPAPTPAPPPTPAPAPAPAPAPPAPAAATEGGTQPAAMSGPRDSGADDLKRIKGVGPKLEQLLNSLGIYHFDQIAGWSADEVAWVDENLKGFKGRVTRDEWVSQAALLASGGETTFSKKVDDGDVY